MDDIIKETTGPVILVTGACGQIGTELVTALRAKYGKEAVVASDIHAATPTLQEKGPYAKLNVLDKGALVKLVNDFGITQIYHLAAVLSASGEKNPLVAWELNMAGLLNVLETARLHKLDKIFWPSSIAVFGPSSPHNECPQDALTDPTTVYGISKCAGENWCAYYHRQYGLDVRSIRYPGLISYSANAGGGTTDYAVEIFHEAIKNGSYTCFLKEDTGLPMMYMEDAVNATIQLMEAPEHTITVRNSYNIAGMSFTPAELIKAIKKHIPELEVMFKPDSRQQIADSWPASINDEPAKKDWGLHAKYDLAAMVADMLLHLNPATKEKLLFN
ncbi:NAD-dependent epimerase/dehydratase family protein [Mucilaginibacter sp.]|uniref:NAD-dependent epimerase/dehydratase family protein n=1 Tax=Mucilaginibacter sp. TaxID=1882438 RepID=UPI003D1188DD